MEIRELIMKRRATPPNLFGKGEVSKEEIQYLLECAHWAPNHKKTEPWRFKVFTDNAKNEFAQAAEVLLREEKNRGLPIGDDKIAKFVATLKRVPVVIAIMVENDAAGRLPEWEEIAAVSMAVQNMWLAATAKDLAAFWATPFFVDLFSELLGLREGQKSLGFFYVGRAIMDYPSPGRGELEPKVEWK